MSRRPPPAPAPALFGPRYYDSQIRELSQLLRDVPDIIPLGTVHDFSNFVLNQAEVVDKGTKQGVVNAELERSFGNRADGRLIEFKSRGPGLEAVATVLREYITGPGGENPILVKWVDDLTAAATHVIEEFGKKKRKRQITEARRRMEDEEDEEEAQKRVKRAEVEDRQIREVVATKAAEITRQGAVNHAFDDLEDLPIPTKSNRGRNPDPVLDELTIACRTKSLDPRTQKPQKRFRCSAPGCHESWAYPRNGGRILPHAAQCEYFPLETRQMAAAANGKKALSNEVDVEADGGDGDASDASPNDATQSNSGTHPYFDPFRGLGAEERKKALKSFKKKSNLLLLEFLCVTGRAMRHIDVQSFHKLAYHLNPHHGFFSSTTMTEYVHRECAKIMQEDSEHLSKIRNLTMSYDGATLFGQSIYNGNITTPKKRDSYLMMADEASGDSHTGDYIERILLEVIEHIGPFNFAALVSDDAGNTRVARERVSEKYPTIIALADAPHHLSNLIKDIVKLAHFEKGIEKMRAVITFFSSSTYAGTHLKALRVVLDITKGLETIGNTRFGTMYWSGYALLRNLPAIHELARLGIVRTDGSEELSKLAFLRKVPSYQSFKNNIEQLVVVLEPIARAIQCLEGAHTTVGDVWKFYVAITAVLHDAFEDNALAIPDDVISEIRRIVNTRYDQLIGSSDIYLAGFLLDPQYVTSSILRRPTGNVLSQDVPAESEPASDKADADLRAKMPTYAIVGRYIIDLLRNELKARPELRQNRIFARFPDRKTTLEALGSQYEMFVRQRSPFNRRDPSWTRAYLFWHALLAEPDASVLAWVAVKIFAIMPTSMPEERTVSVFSKLSTKDRNRQDAATTVAITKVRERVLRRDQPRKPPVLPRLNWRSVKAILEPVSADTPTAASAVVDLTADGSDTERGAPHEEVVDGEAADKGADAVAAGLNALNAPDEAVVDVTLIPSFETETFEAAAQVDITDPFFRDLLSDTVVPGAVGGGGVARQAAKETETSSEKLMFDDNVDDFDF